MTRKNAMAAMVPAITRSVTEMDYIRGHPRHLLENQKYSAEINRKVIFFIAFSVSNLTQVQHAVFFLKLEAHNLNYTLQKHYPSGFANILRNWHQDAALRRPVKAADAKKPRVMLNIPLCLLCRQINACVASGVRLQAAHCLLGFAEEVTSMDAFVITVSFVTQKKQEVVL